MSRPLAVIVLAAGLGTRTKMDVAKALLPLCGRTLLRTVLDAVAELRPDRTLVVLHHQKERVEASLSGRADLEVVDQGEPRGTGHAVRVAAERLGRLDGDVLILNGDCPLIRPATLQRLREARGGAAAAILTAEPADPGGLGRILRDPEGKLRAIREERDCDATERAVGEVNAGFYCFDAVRLGAVLPRLSDDNAQHEYYLTQAVELLIGDGEEVVAVPAPDPQETMGVNTLAELAAARAVMQERILSAHLAAGVLIEDPATTYIDWDVEIGAGTRVLPCTVIRSGVRIGAGCEVGPFSHLRAGAILEDGAEVGNFVEVKNSRIGRGTKAKHLTYLGDAEIGQRANIGAGTITANYDGRAKHATVIGERAFIGSGTVLVAPSSVGKGAMTGAGAVVTRNSEIPAGDVWVGVPARPLARRRSAAEEEAS